jgi:acetyltransferase-like isoleucine patch superfamily enzyme
MQSSFSLITSKKSNNLSLTKLLSQLINLPRKSKLRNHKKDLEKKCILGYGFCTSSFYNANKYQLLNVKVNNKTGDKKNIEFGKSCNVSCKTTLNERGSIHIGEFVFMNYVKMRIDYDLSIGSHCMFGPNVVLWDTDNHPLCVQTAYSV